MKTFSNPESILWVEDLSEDTTLRKYLPMTSISVMNNGSLPVKIWIHGSYIGECQGYSAFNLIGKPFETFKIYNKDDQLLNLDDLEVTVGKNETISNMAYNPQNDLMEENLDKFASGCNHRISFVSGTIPEGVHPEDIKYYINANNDLIVQRRIEIEGTVSMGQYDITYSTIDHLTGSVGIWMVTTNEKRIKKTITSREFDYSQTNCSISGWIIDLNMITDIMDLCTLITGDSECYDNDLSKHGSYSAVGATTVFEASFDSKDITVANIGCWLGQAGTNWAFVFFDLYYSGAWHNIYTDSRFIAGWTDESSNVVGSWSGVTKVRVRLQGSGANSAYLKLKDITLVE